MREQNQPERDEKAEQDGHADRAEIETSGRRDHQPDEHREDSKQRLARVAAEAVKPDSFRVEAILRNDPVEEGRVSDLRRREDSERLGDPGKIAVVREADDGRDEELVSRDGGGDG